MPMHLQAMNRRQFLARTVAGSAGFLAISYLQAEGPDSTSEAFALLADTHIPSDPTTGNAGINMADHLQLVAGRLTALGEKPAAVLIVGDCAFQQGLEGDYALLGKLLMPIRERGLDIHMALGNHDHRENFAAAFLKDSAGIPAVMGKHVSILQTNQANWFMLDSLMQVNVVTGEIGDPQLGWLAKVLDMHANKPAMIVVHHPFQWEVKEGETIGGIKDSKPLFDVLQPRKHVKAFIYGHTHRWGIGERDGIHLINLPPVAYVFDEKHPWGWVSARTKPDSLTIELHAFDNHPANGEQHDLKWRAS